MVLQRGSAHESYINVQRELYAHEYNITWTDRWEDAMALVEDGYPVPYTRQNRNHNRNRNRCVTSMYGIEGVVDAKSPHLALAYLFLPCLALPYLAFPCLTLTSPTLPYPTLPYRT